MHVMLSKEQFEELKKKAGASNGKDKGKDTEAKGAENKKADSGKDKGEEKKPNVKLKEDDDTHGTIETDDFVVGYFYNASEGRLFIGPVSKRKTLAAYVAGDNIIGTYLMDIFASMPSSKEKKEDKKEDKESEEKEESQEKKDQSQHQNQYGTASEQNQPSQ